MATQPTFWSLAVMKIRFVTEVRLIAQICDI